MRCDHSGHHMIPPLYITHKWESRQPEKYSLLKRSTDSLYHSTPQILHTKKIPSWGGGPIILESATRNNLEVYTPINQHPSDLLLLGYSQQSVAATSKGNLEICNCHLMVGKVRRYTHCFYIPFNASPIATSPDKNKYMEKYMKYFCK